MRLFLKSYKRAMPALDRSPECLALETLFMLLTSTRPDCAIIFIKGYILIYDPVDFRVCPIIQVIDISVFLY